MELRFKWAMLAATGLHAAMLGWFARRGLAAALRVDVGVPYGPGIPYGIPFLTTAFVAP